VRAIIFGAGKIARGFVAHLLHISGIPFTLVESNRDLVALLNMRGSYHIEVMGNPEKSLEIPHVRALALDDRKAVAQAWSEASLAFTCVGGKNLEALARDLAAILEIRHSLTPDEIRGNLITCENWKEPAALLRARILENVSPAVGAQIERGLGFSEAVVMRSGIEPTDEQRARDPLWVNVQDFWELPVDAGRIVGSPMPIEGVRYIEGFAGYLERKFYTYNAANATTSYLGYLRGHKYLADAAHDPWIVEMLHGVYDETSRALVAKHGTSLGQQQAFADSSFKKLQDRNIADYVERNARDPIRKLGPQDRLIGSARLVLAQGIEPRHLTTSIVAAMHYDEPTDPSAIVLSRLLKSGGIDEVLIRICQVDPAEPLGRLVKQAESALRGQKIIV
jgi:mannitol-1-phosphate 5-dehydrogenase